jgi:hypothetical protein
MSDPALEAAEVRVSLHLRAETYLSRSLKSAEYQEPSVEPHLRV